MIKQVLITQFPCTAYRKNRKQLAAKEIDYWCIFSCQKQKKNFFTVIDTYCVVCEAAQHRGVKRKRLGF